MAANPNQPRPYAQAGFVPNGAPGVPGVPAVPPPGAVPLLPNQGRIIQQGSVRVLCVADVRGNLRSLNDLAASAKANYIIHTGDFGFYDNGSLDRIAEKTLRHVAQYSPLLSEHVKRQIAQSAPMPSIKERFSPDELPLSELPDFLNKKYKLDVPVYTVWGACEDVQVLEKLRSGEYKVNNLHIIDEAHSRLLDVGGVKLRLLGLGGAVVMHKLFDNGEGRTTIAGGQGTMWTTLLQMGELIDTAQRVYDPTETRIFVTHASPAREGLLNQLSVTLKSDFSISAGLHFRYGSSYNEFSVNPTLDHYRGKLAASKASFDDVWQTVRSEVEPAVAENEPQNRLLRHALDLVEKMPMVANGGNPFGGSAGIPGTGQIDESAFKNMWNFNLADAAYGWLVLDIEGGRIGTEMKAQGFNFSHRTGKQPQPSAAPIPAAPPVVAPGPAPVAPVVTPGPPPPAVAQVPARQTPPVTGQPGRGPQTQNQPPRGTHSPRPASSKDISKPSSAAGQSSDRPNTDAKTNGTTAPEKAQDAKTDTRNNPQALFVKNCKDEDDVRSQIAEEDRPKIDRVERSGMFHIVHFKNPDDMQAAYKRIPMETKSRGPMEGPPKPNISIYRPQGSWPGNQRGGQHGGYRGPATGTASDSDNPGRGGFRGRNRGGGGRGDRGGRGPRRGFSGAERGGPGSSGKGGEGNNGGQQQMTATPTANPPAQAPSAAAASGGGDS